MMRFSRAQTDRLYDMLTLSRFHIDRHEWWMGINTECEHANDPLTAITSDPIIIGKIALAHLKENSRYYTILKSVGL